MNSPGSGKTSLLDRTIRMLHDEVPISVIEGDQATTNDAERIRGPQAAGSSRSTPGPAAISNRTC